MATQSPSTVRTQLWRLVALLVVGVLLALVAGSLLGTPILLSFVETGSMEPTIQTGDGFVVLPPAVTGDPSTGDVVVFDARELEGGGLTTHRIVDETADGYITQGDANPFADQDDSEPPVSDDQIVAVAWQPNGEVVTIPQLGTASMALQESLETTQLRALGGRSTVGDGGPSVLLVVGVGLIVASFLLDQRSSTSRSVSRSRSRTLSVEPRTVAVAVGLVVCVMAAGTMVAMADSSELTVISAEFDSDRPDVIQQGTTERHPFDLDNSGLLPVVTVLESPSERLIVEDSPAVLLPGASSELEVSITARSETGQESHQLTEYRYFGVLPPDVVMGLHAIHPAAAIAAISLTIGAAISAPLALLVATSTVQRRTRRRSRSRSQSRTQQEDDGFW